MHGNLSQFFYAFGLGLLLGYVYARTGKLRYSIGLHMIINFMGSFVGILILRLSESLDLPALSNMNPADYASVFESLGAKIWLLLAIGLYGFVIFSLFIAGLVFLIRGRKQIVLTKAQFMIPSPGAPRP
jgi:membrane protease YdiL (CAAX protease family)